MRLILLAMLLAGGLRAAVIRGIVVDDLGGHPLSRATVTVEPVPGTRGKRLTTHTDRFGSFEFDGEVAGMYLLHASRLAFLTTDYGQKRWNSAGLPLTVTENDSTFVTIRLLRFSSISGIVMDENDVGMPDFEVVAYRNTRPPQIAGRAVSDERGFYRIYGLLPGSYVVRTASKSVDDLGYKATFGKETDLVDQARLVDVAVQEEATQMHVRPLQGQLYTLTASTTPLDPPDVPVTMTLVSEMARQEVNSASYRFTGLAPGEYELFAEAPSEPKPQMQGNYQRFVVGRDMNVGLTLKRSPEIVFQFDGVPVQIVNDRKVQVLARRKDMVGAHSTQILKLVNNRATLAYGPWEFAVAPPEGYYVSSYSGPSIYLRRPRPDGWDDATVREGGTVRFGLSSNPATLHGMVSDHGAPVAGVPVFLEPTDLEPARRITDMFVAITDLQGQYKFTSLAPGLYRLLSSFEYQMPDSRIMKDAGTHEFRLEPKSDTIRDLSLYVIQ